ncbi:hypothetical protein EYF80_054669 [Liparis tanakae]|uniref:Uncharacterized protein n=1 Tax=Liparis tanakae TaxID=230148 RepID=A0A4Z2F1X5_9TELE|nr:hypothetical protein EYF80_054669 [Liparis tanakae]
MLRDLVVAKRTGRPPLTELDSGSAQMWCSVQTSRSSTLKSSCVERDLLLNVGQEKLEPWYSSTGRSRPAMWRYRVLRLLPWSAALKASRHGEPRVRAGMWAASWRQQAMYSHSHMSD